MFDLPVPPGYTKDGTLKWLIRNEPWKTKTNQRRNGLNRDIEDDGIVFEAAGDSPIIGRNKSSNKEDFDIKRFEELESQLTDSDDDSIEADSDSPVIGRSKSPSKEDFDLKRFQKSQLSASDDDSIVFETDESK